MKRLGELQNKGIGVVGEENVIEVDASQKNTKNPKPKQIEHQSS